MSVGVEACRLLMEEWWRGLYLLGSGRKKSNDTDVLMLRVKQVKGGDGSD